MCRARPGSVRAPTPSIHASPMRSRSRRMPARHEHGWTCQWVVTTKSWELEPTTRTPLSEAVPVDALVPRLGSMKTRRVVRSKRAIRARRLLDARVRRFGRLQPGQQGPMPTRASSPAVSLYVLVHVPFDDVLASECSMAPGAGPQPAPSRQKSRRCGIRPRELFVHVHSRCVRPHGMSRAKSPFH